MLPLRPFGKMHVYYLCTLLKWKGQNDEHSTK